MRYKSLIFILLLFASRGHSQVQDSPIPGSQVFTSVDELISFAMDNSLDLENNQIKFTQAQKSRLAALISTIDVTGSLLSAQFVDNTKLGVNLFPSEIFGGTPGTFKEVQTGVQYNTGLNNYLDIKLYNPNGYNNVKLANLNIELTKSNNLIGVKQYQDNLVANYYNIVNIQKQIKNTAQNIRSSDSLLTIVEHKYREGLVKQQDVNDTKINHLQLEETYRQQQFLEEQYYLSLKTLADIPEEVGIEIRESEGSSIAGFMPPVHLNKLGIENSVLREKYAMQSLKAAKQSFLPTVSFQFSNSWNLYNTEFQPVSGNWINSNYVGLKLNIPIPNSQQVANKYNAQFDYEIAANNTTKERNKSILQVKKYESEFLQAQSQIRSNEEILKIQRDTYAKNLNLYDEGIVGLDVTIQSLNAVFAAEHNLITAVSNLDLVNAKINVNNKIN